MKGKISMILYKTKLRNMIDRRWIKRHEEFDIKTFYIFSFFYIVLPAIKNRRYPPVDLEFIMKISSTQHDFFITKEQNLFTCRKIKFLKNIANFLVSRKWEWNRIEKKYLTRWRNNFQFTSIPRHTDERLQLIQHLSSRLIRGKSWH